MPLYTFVCESCGFEEEALLSVSERNTTDNRCADCGQTMVRRIDAVNFKTDPYQMKAILSDGQHVPGHFGKTAKKK